MKISISIGLPIIILSMVFILFISMNFSKSISECIEKECNTTYLFFSMMFGFFICGIFLIIDIFICYMIYRKRPSYSGESFKHADTKNKVEDIREQIQAIKESKKEAEKQYYKGKIDTDTFKKMLDGYDRKAIELESRIKVIGSKKRGMCLAP